MKPSDLKKAILRARKDLPFDLWGAILFGSHAKNEETEHSDLDLLVGAEGINPKLHRRGEEISLLRKKLPDLPFDILLLTPKEIISNFKNHNPLFLDIATEGVILFDNDSFLKKLVLETRKYIEERGIQKIDSGWQYPVKRGETTL